jgi:hypothetical protein
MRDTFAPHIHGDLFLVLTMGGRSIWVFPGVSGLPEVSEFTPNTPGLKAVMAIFWVRGYKSPLHPFLYPLSCHFDLQTFRPLYSLLYSPWLKFGEIVVRI